MALAGLERNRIFASPLARRMAALEGLDLGQVQGTGPHGRIIKIDIERALSSRDIRTSPAPETPTTAPKRVVEELPLSSMRKVIARRLTESKQSIPHFYLTVDCTLDPLLDLRAKLNARAKADYKLSINDLLIKAAALALKAHPDVNASWGGDKILRFRDVDVAVAVAVEGGLVTPVIRRADEKSIVAISTEMKELATRARQGKLAPEEYQGGGFSISNLGMYGISSFSAVINPPQAAILAVGAAREQAVVRGGKVKAATVMTCTLSVDHRAVDGALGARFLSGIKELVEDPLALLV
ncbi:MAG: 2-oxo acid dehydrogenase subunit E2 [Geminicoccaceae bacterium]